MVIYSLSNSTQNTGGNRINVFFLKSLSIQTTLRLSNLLRLSPPPNLSPILCPSPPHTLCARSRRPRSSVLVFVHVGCPNARRVCWTNAEIRCWASASASESVTISACASQFCLILDSSLIIGFFRCTYCGTGSLNFVNYPISLRLRTAATPIHIGVGPKSRPICWSKNRYCGSTTPYCFFPNLLPPKRIKFLFIR